MIGKTVTVYDRYLFAVPVRGTITDVAEKDGAFRVTFFPDNPAAQNVMKHNGRFFHWQQCEVDGENKKSKPNTELIECLELLNAIETIEYHNKNWLATFANRSPANMNREKRALLEKAIGLVGSSASQSFT